MLLFVLLLSVLSACNSNGVYKKYGSVKINDMQTYYKDYGNRECDVESTINMFVEADDTTYVITTSFGSCSFSLFIKDDANYITLNEAIKQDIITAESVLGYDWDFEYYEVHDLINDITIDYITLENRDRSEIITITEDATITSIQSSSTYYYQKFMIGFTSTDILDGYITLVSTTGETYVLEVTYDGVYYSEMNSFQKHSELLELFKAHFEAPYDKK